MTTEEKLDKNQLSRECEQEMTLKIMLTVQIDIKKHFFNFPLTPALNL